MPVPLRVVIANSPSPSTTPTPDQIAAQMLDSAHKLNAITLVALIVSATVGTVIYLNFVAQLRDFKLQRTIRLIDDWFREGPTGLSPYQALMKGRETGPAIQEALNKEEDRYAVISYYFDNAWFLDTNGFLNREYFLGRMARIALWAREEMKGLEKIFAAQGKLPEGPSSIQRVADAARGYAKKHGFFRE